MTLRWSAATFCSATQGAPKASDVLLLAPREWAWRKCDLRRSSSPPASRPRRARDEHVPGTAVPAVPLLHGFRPLPSVVAVRTGPLRRRTVVTPVGRRRTGRPAAGGRLDR